MTTTHNGHDRTLSHDLLDPLDDAENVSVPPHSGQAKDAAPGSGTEARPFT